MGVGKQPEELGQLSLFDPTPDRGATPPAAPPPEQPRSDERRGFDYTAALERLIGHIVRHCDEFSTIRMENVLVMCSQAKRDGRVGVWASVRPMRFEGGAKTKTVGGRTYEMPRLLHDGREILYAIDFMLPRFADLTFDEKITAVIHELYHISPEFNGDIRRLPGRNYAHGRSRSRYDEALERFKAEYLSLPNVDEYAGFLRRSFRELEKRHDGVRGLQPRLPRARRID